MPHPPRVVAIISPDRNLHEAIASAFHGNIEIETVWTLAEYPDSTALTELQRAEGGCVIYLDFSDPVRAKAVAAELDRSYPMATTIAVHSVREPQDFVELMRLGIREVVALPVSSNDVLQSFSRVGRSFKTPALPEGEGGKIYAFLPSKPGAGSTTLAIHSAATAARLSGRRTLLLDFDFRLGMTSFLLKLNGNYSVLDAISAQGGLESELFDRMVSRRGNLDILGSAPVDFGQVNPEDGAVDLVDLARRSYQTVCVDLPGEMRPYELETMNLAKECLLVTTPDIGALHMAKRKAEFLRTVGLQNKVSVIMNRAEQRNGLALKDVETILQLPVRFSVSSAEKQIAESIQSGTAIEGRSTLLTQIEAIARRISPGPPAAAPAKPRKFIEMFSVSAVRDRNRWGW